MVESHYSSIAAELAQVGFAHVRNFFPAAEIAAVERELIAIESDPTSSDQANIRFRHKIDPQSLRQLLDAIDPVTDLSPTAKTIAAAPSLLELLGTIYSDKAFLFKDKAVVKPGGCPGYTWHQDHISWPLFPSSFITVVIAINRSDAENGAICVAPRSHLQGCLSPNDGEFHDLPAPDQEIIVGMEPGDILLFGSMLVHGSRRNNSKNPRRNLYLSYNSGSDGGDLRTLHYRFFHQWLKKRYANYGHATTYFR